MATAKLIEAPAPDLDANVDIDAARAKVWKIRDALMAALSERDDAIEALLCAFVSHEHVVFEGPPGTAKSLAVDALMRCVTGGNYVRRLMHKFMTADELIGPMDLAEFQKNQRFRRVLDNGAVDANGLFLDEIFKSNAAVLNLLLTLLEERLYADQAGSINAPLRMCASASNEFPQDDTLGALYDRFLFRHRVRYIANRRNKRALLVKKAAQAKALQAFKPPCTITVGEWDAVAADIDTVVVPETLIDKLLDFQELLAADGIIMSDRRSVKILRAIKASAWLDGDDVASIDHLHVLKFCAWDTPEEQEKVVAALKTLERSATREALDSIDEVLRAFNSRPEQTQAYHEAIPGLMVKLTSAGKAIKKKVEAGEYTKRGAEKINRRMLELKSAYAHLERDFNQMNTI